MGAWVSTVPAVAGVVQGGPCIYRGVSIRDTSGAPNTVTLYDNASAASGTVVATFQLAAGTDKQDAPDGVRCVNGLFLQVSGAIAGSVRIG